MAKSAKISPIRQEHSQTSRDVISWMFSYSPRLVHRDISRYRGRTVLIDQIQQTRETLEKLLTLLQSAPVERDRFVSHLYQARRKYRRTCETAGKSGKQIERCVIASFRSRKAWASRANFAMGALLRTEIIIAALARVAIHSVPLLRS